MWIGIFLGSTTFLVWLRGPDAVDQRRAHAQLVAKQRIGKISGPRQADAAMAEGAGRVGELVLGGRVVKVDVVGIGQHELHLAEGVFRTRLLAEGEGELAGTIGTPS